MPSTSTAAGTSARPSTADAAIARLARSRHGLLTTQLALATGITRAQLRA